MAGGACFHLHRWLPPVACRLVDNLVSLISFAGLGGEHGGMALSLRLEIA